MTLIEIRKVGKSYSIGDRSFPVLKDVSLKISERETLAIQGPSGSGKSTLLNIIGLIDKPTSGKVLIEGRDASKTSDDEAAEIRRNKIGFIFQFFYLIPSLDALQNVALPMVFNDVEKAKREKRSKELLEEVGLKKRMNHMPSQLSGGERQRVAIARALANNPKIILADEPTGNLDSRTGKEIVDILMRLNRERNTTLITVTHEKSIALKMGRIIRIRDGEIDG